MQNSFHYYLKSSFSWYRNWHNHPRHQHTHWLLFIVFVISASLFVSSQINIFDSENQYLSISGIVHAQTGLTLGINGDKFTVNGIPKFLLMLSYFDGLGASDATLQSDFDQLKAKGFDGIRVLVNWPCEGCTYSSTNHRLSSSYTSTLNTTALNKLKSLIGFASSRGMIIDVTFHDRGTFSSFNSYRDFVVNAANALPSSTYKNVIFDLQNEANDSGLTFLSDSERTSLRNAVNGADSGRLLTISTTGGNGTEASFVSSYNLDFMGGHDMRTSTWYNDTDNYVSTARSSMGTTAPIYLQEPSRANSTSTASNWYTAAKNAKCAGAAGWLLHTDGTRDSLNDGSMMNNLSTAETQIMNGLKAQIDSITWDSCRSGGGSTPPPGGVTGTYQGACPSGYVAISGANASGADPTETGGFYCDDDGIDSSVTGITYPVAGLLVCNDTTSSSHAFVVPSSMWPCNAGRPGNPGWTFVGGRPYKNGNPVTIIAELSCGSGGTTPVTINSSSVHAGAWTQNPSTEGLLCVRGTIATVPTPTPSLGGGMIITSISPNPAAEGSTVTIKGQNLNLCGPTGGPACNVQFHDLTGRRSTVSGREIDSTTVTAVVAPGLCSGTGSVRIGEIDYPSNSIVFSITSGTETDCDLNRTTNRYIYYIYPNRAPAGAPITIAGENLNETVHFYDLDGTEYRATGTVTGTLNNINVYVDVNVPVGLAPGLYTVKVGSGSTTDLSNSHPFTVTPDIYIPDPSPDDPPVITGFSPSTVSQGGTIEIYGNNLPRVAKFIDASGQATIVLGWINGEFDILTVGIPINFLPGQYTIEVTSLHGTATSSDLLTVIPGSVDVTAAATGINIPGSTTTFESLISNSLTYAVYGLGIAIFVTILYAGFLWMTSAASPGNIALAKRYITNAILGAVLLLSSYIILYTINPDLVGGTLTLPEITQGPIAQPPPPLGAVCPASVNQYNKPDNGCAGCVAIDVGISRKSGVGGIKAPNPLVASSVNSGLVTMLGETVISGIDWEVTEAYCPTVSHLDSSHYNGHGIDIAMRSSITAANLDQLCLAAQTAGFTIANEYYSLRGSSFQYCPPIGTYVTTTGNNLHLEQ